MRVAALAFALIALGACQYERPSQDARGATVTPLSVEGYGPMRIGMTLAEARTASGQPMNNEALEPDVPGACVEQEYNTTDGDKLWVMFEEDRITRITAGEAAPRTRTPQNVGVGSTDAEIRAAYQNVLEQGAHYNPPPAHNLVVWTVPEESGLLFEVDEHNMVTAVHAGGPSILYMEGCA